MKIKFKYYGPPSGWSATFYTKRSKNKWLRFLRWANNPSGKRPIWADFNTL